MMKLLVAALLVSTALSATVPPSATSPNATTSLTTTTVRYPRDVRYDDQQLVRVPNTKRVSRVVEKMALDVWAHAAEGLDVRVTPQQLAKLQRDAGLTRAPVQVLNANIQAVIDRETAELRAQASMSKSTADWFTAYHSFDDVVPWLQKLATDHPKTVTLVASIGKTVQGREIPMLKITGATRTAKKTVWLQGLQHAREWISTATVQYIANALATGYGVDARVTALLDQVTFLLVPVSNPDGYVYSWTTDRLWRKNRALPSGVDLNRNWPYKWGMGGSSKNPSSDTYMGPSPGSEPEVQALVAAYKAAADNMVAAVDIHSYSQLILRPYGFSQTQAPDNANLVAAGDVMKTTIQASRGTAYTNQRSIDLYPVSGDSGDYFYDYQPASGQRAYGLGMELSPKQGFGGNGFILPPSQIVPVGKEVFPAILALVEYALKHPLSFKTTAKASDKAEQVASGEEASRVGS